MDGDCFWPESSAVRPVGVGAIGWTPWSTAAFATDDTALLAQTRHPSQIAVNFAARICGFTHFHQSLCDKFGRSKRLNRPYCYFFADHRSLMRILYFISRILLLPLVFGVLPVGAAQSVNGQAIAQNRLDTMLALRLAAGQKDDESTRQQAREDLIRLEVLMQAARKAGAETPLVRAQAQNAADNVLVRAYLQQWMRQNPVSKEAVAREYEAIKARSGTQELQLRQILVASEDDARKVLAQLASGSKFEDLAQLASRDASSRLQGGLLSWVPVGALNPVIAQEAAKLTKGQTSKQPVQTPAGFHVLRLEDSRPLNMPPLEQLQPQIVRNLENQAVEAHVRQLREQALVK